MQAATALSETESSLKEKQEMELLKQMEEHNALVIEKYIDDQKRGVGELRKKKIRDTLRKLEREASVRKKTENFRCRLSAKITKPSTRTAQESVPAAAWRSTRGPR